MVTIRREQKNQDVDSSTHRWQIIYCSFALILIVFFVMILSNSVVSGKSVTLVQQQFSRDGASQGYDSFSPREQNQDMPVVVLNEAAKQLQLEQVTALKMTSAGIDIALPKHLFFLADKNDVETQIFPYLNVIGDVVAKNGFNLQIRVYDALPEEKNDMSIEDKQMFWRQSAYRAVNIMRYFLAYGRLAPDQVAAFGFVSQEPFLAESNPSSQGRVELHLAVQEINKK